MSAKMMLVGQPEALQIANGVVTFRLVTGPGASAPPLPWRAPAVGRRRMANSE